MNNIFVETMKLDHCLKQRVLSRPGWQDMCRCLIFWNHHYAYLLLELQFLYGNFDRSTMGVCPHASNLNIQNVQQCQNPVTHPDKLSLGDILEHE